MPYKVVARKTAVAPFYNKLFLEPEWAIDSETIRARGIIVLVKSNELVKNSENKKDLAC